MCTNSRMGFGGLGVGAGGEVTVAVPGKTLVINEVSN